MKESVLPGSVFIGANSVDGLDRLKLFKALRIGDVARTYMTCPKDEAFAYMNYCREHRIPVILAEITQRHTFLPHPALRDPGMTKADRDRLIDTAGKYFLGRHVLGESGGIIYWPKTYTLGRRAGAWEALPPVRTMAEGKETYVTMLKRFVDHERSQVGHGPLIGVDSSIVFKYFCEAGIDMLGLEMMPGDPDLMLAAIRGAASAYGKRWFSHIAIGCYGGVHFDELWLNRWQTALNACFIAGANGIWPESGHFTYDQRNGQKFELRSPEMKAMRRRQRKVWQFTRIHTRPPQGPRVGLGVIHGHLDGAPGLWNPYAWGQYHDEKWQEGAAERGWQLVDKFYRKENWAKETVQGETDFSGNPPYGQYDLVPAESTLEHLKKYSCLVCLGWNTMTPDFYANLKAYVHAGGHLLMWLPQLSTHTDRAKDLQLYRKGDFRDLFGVQILGKGKTDTQGVKCFKPSSLAAYRLPLWRIKTDPRFYGRFTPARCRVTSGQVLSGWSDYYDITPEELEKQPMLIENSLGKGKAFLVTAWEYPADEGLRKFTDDMLRTVLQGEQGEIRLLGSDRVRYAVYKGAAPETGRAYEVIYLLNTDPACSTLAQLWVRGYTTLPLGLDANELRLVYRLGDLLVAPANSQVDLSKWKHAGSGEWLEFYNGCDQQVDLFNLGRKPIRITVNGVKRAVPAQGHERIGLKRKVDPARKEFFEPDFLEE